VPAVTVDRRPSLWLIYSITVTGVTVNTLVAPALPDILAGLDVGARMAGLVVAAASAPGILLAPAIGLLADRFGRREVLVPCLVIFGVSGGLVAVSTNVWMLVALRFAQGVGSAGLINLAVVLIGDHWEGTERVRMMGRNAAVLTVAVAAFPLLGGALTDLGGWEAPFLLYPLSLITAAVALRGLPRSPTLDVRTRDQVVEAWPYVRTARILGTFVAGILVMVLIFGLFFTVLPLYVERAFGLGPTARGLVLTLPALTSTLSSLALGRMESAAGRRRVLVGSAGLFAVSLGMVAAVPALWALAVGVLVFGFGQGILIPALQDVAASAAPDHSRGTLVALWVSAVRLGQTVGPLIASPVFARLDGPATFAAGSVLSIAMGVGFAFGGRGSGRARDRTLPPAPVG